MPRYATISGEDNSQQPLLGGTGQQFPNGDTNQIEYSIAVIESSVREHSQNIPVNLPIERNNANTRNLNVRLADDNNNLVLYTEFYNYSSAYFIKSIINKYEPTISR